jgi:hypothetical protein
MSPAALSLSPSPPRASSSRQHITPAVPVVSGSGARVPTQFLDQKGGFSRSKQQVQNGNHQSSAGSSNGNGKATLDNAVDLTGDDTEEFTVVEARGPSMIPDPNQQVCIGLINAVVLTMFGLPETFVAPPNVKIQDLNAHPKWKTDDWPNGAGFYLEAGYRPVELLLRGGGTPSSKAGDKPEIQVHEIVPPLDVKAQLEGTGRPIPKGPQLRSAPFGSLAEKYNKGLHALLARKMIKISARCRIVAPNSGQVSDTREVTFLDLD